MYRLGMIHTIQDAAEISVATDRLGARRIRRAAIWSVVALLVGLSSSCSRGVTPVVANGDPDLVAGREIFIRNCTNCHGAAGNGGRGPRLSEGRVVERYPEIEDQIAIVSEGKSGMPSFSGRLDAEEIEQVVRFTRESL